METMEDLEAEDEDEVVRLKACGWSKVLKGVLVSSSCFEVLESPEWEDRSLHWRIRFIQC